MCWLGFFVESNQNEDTRNLSERAGRGRDFRSVVNRRSSRRFHHRTIPPCREILILRIDLLLIIIELIRSVLLEEPREENALERRRCLEMPRGLDQVRDGERGQAARDGRDALLEFDHVILALGHPISHLDKALEG